MSRRVAPLGGNSPGGGAPRPHTHHGARGGRSRGHGLSVAVDMQAVPLPQSSPGGRSTGARSSGARSKRTTPKSKRHFKFGDSAAASPGGRGKAVSMRTAAKYGARSGQFDSPKTRQARDKLRGKRSSAEHPARDALPRPHSVGDGLSMRGRRASYASPRDLSRPVPLPPLGKVRASDTHALQALRPSGVLRVDARAPTSLAKGGTGGRGRLSTAKRAKEARKYDVIMAREAPVEAGCGPCRQMERRWFYYWGNFERPSRVNHMIYLGDREDARDRRKLLRLGITHVLNCAAQLDNHFPDDCERQRRQCASPCVSRR